MGEDGLTLMEIRCGLRNDQELGRSMRESRFISHPQLWLGESFETCLGRSVPKTIAQ
jgi:hypothetical protein